ncbi:MAG: hypothetical protein KDA51_20680 [Planctomycetales bacterium]|nr:hypothetical protein [Planctomycetales bacterium]
MKTTTLPFALLCCLTLMSSGCSVFGNKPKNAADKSWSISKLWKKDYQKPNTLSVIWSPDVLTLTGKPPTRGFGGRVFFYNDRTQAIPVEGDLIVHGYRGDPMLGESEQVQADKTFRFTAEQLTGHFSPSELGASYSVWIPWDAADGLRQEITLIPTFKGLDGQIVQGAPAKLFLPGRSIDSVAKHSAGSTSTDYGFETQTVSYQQRSIPTNASGNLPHMERRTEPTTIELPALGSLGRPRAQQAASPVHGFTLGPPSGTQTPAAFAPNTPSGAGLPGAGTTPPNAVPQATTSTPTTVNDLPAPAAATQPAGNQSTNNPAAMPVGRLGAGMAPTVPGYGEQAGAKFSLQPWNSQP